MRKGKYWCENGCGKKVEGTFKYVPYEDTKKQIYLCEVCNATYILKNYKEVMEYEEMGME